MRVPRTSVRRPALPAVALGLIAVLLLAAAPATASGRPSVNAALAAIERAIPFAGAAWGVDTRANQILVTVDSTVTGARLAEGEGSGPGPRRRGAAEFAAGTFTSYAVIGGDAIYGSKYRCSLGFNVRSGSTYYFLTAGHCGKPEHRWWTSANHSTLLGDTTSASFPGNDYAIVRYAAGYAVDTPGLAGNVNISGAAQCVRRACQSRATEARPASTAAQVTALNVTVRYQGGGTVGR